MKAPEIIQALKQAGIRQEDIADYVGVAQGSVSGWLRGAVPSSDNMDALRAFARERGVTLESGGSQATQPFLPPENGHLDNLGRRVRDQIVALFDGNESELARQINTEQQNVNNFIHGRVTRSSHWRQIAAALRIPEEEMRLLMLERGRSEGKNTKLPTPFRVSDHTESNAKVGALQPADAGRPRMLPVLGEAVGGDNGEYNFNGQALDYVPCPPLLANVPNAYVVFVDGESMVPRYMPGEVAFVHPGKPARKNDHVVVQLRPADENAPPRGFIKRFLGWTPTKLILEQYNPHKKIEFDREDVISVHQIVLAGDY